MSYFLVRRPYDQTFYPAKASLALNLHHLAMVNMRGRKTGKVVTTVIWLAGHSIKFFEPAKASAFLAQPVRASRPAVVRFTSCLTGVSAAAWSIRSSRPKAALLRQLVGMLHQSYRHHLPKLRADDLMKLANAKARHHW
jgi:hypothetical protein